jgi:hypothetical protein
MYARRLGGNVYSGTSGVPTRRNSAPTRIGRQRTAAPAARATRSICVAARYANGDAKS